jgi:hypothetical protein
LNASPLPDALANLLEGAADSLPKAEVRITTFDNPRHDRIAPSPTRPTINRYDFYRIKEQQGQSALSDLARQ